MATFLNVRLTEEDRQLLQDFSAATGLSFSDLVRRSIRLAGPPLVAAMAEASRAVTAMVAAEAPPAPGPEEKP